MSRFNEIISSGKTVLVDFSAEWCGPCKMMAPVLKEVAGMTGDDVKILKIDIDRNQQAAIDFQVQAVPTLIIFKNGVIRWRQSGVIPARQLKSMIDQVNKGDDQAKPPEAGTARPQTGQNKPEQVKP